MPRAPKDFSVYEVEAWAQGKEIPEFTDTKEAVQELSRLILAYRNDPSAGCACGGDGTACACGGHE